MAAEIKKIKPEMDSTPEMILGMLMTHRDKIKHIAAMVVWDDDSAQLVNDPMPHRDMAWLLATFQQQFFTELQEEVSHGN